MKLIDWNPKPCSCEQIDDGEVTLSSTYNGLIIITIRKILPYHLEHLFVDVTINISTELVYDKVMIKKFVEDVLNDYN
jgi:hypothetical protein